MSHMETKPTSLRTPDLLLKVNSRGRRDGPMSFQLISESSQVSGMLASSRVLSAARSPRCDCWIFNHRQNESTKFSNLATNSAADSQIDGDVTQPWRPQAAGPLTDSSSCRALKNGRCSSSGRASASSVKEDAQAAVGQRTM